MRIVSLQYVDGELKIKLPDGVSPDDLVEWLNNNDTVPADVEFVEIPERWTSAEETPWQQAEAERYRQA